MAQQRTKTLGVVMEPEAWRAIRIEAAKQNTSASRLAYEILRAATEDFSFFAPHIRKSEHSNGIHEHQPA